MYSLFKMYIYSFVFVAVLGMIQYVLFKFLHINFYMSIFAATGIVGGFCFVLYIIKMCFGYIKYKKYNLEYLNFVKGLCLGLIFQTLILNMNQNVLRQYFWLNIAVLSVAYRGFAYMLSKEEGQEK